MTEVFKIVLETSVSGGIVALMVITARLIIGRRPNKILPLLYALLIIRLAIPVNVPSPLSVQNLFTAPTVKAEQILEAPNENTQNRVVNTVTEPFKASDLQTAGNAVQESNSTIDTIPAVINGSPKLSVMDICEIIWLSGIAVFSIIMIFGNMRFIRRLRRNREYDSPGFSELLSYCKSELGLRGSIKAVQMSDINTAAVYGAFRPKLLISPSFESLSETQKRHVLLHELSHIKRKDNLICLVASALSIVYWFNPLIWVAFVLMRKDIEVMCDVTALKKIDNKRGYAMTLLNLAGASPAGKPKFVSALFISTDAIKRRIRMIVKNRKNSVLITIIGLILVVVIAVCGCTGAALPTQAQQPAASPSLSQQTTSQAPSVASQAPSASQQETVEWSDSNTLTLKDGSISITVPDGWKSKDVSDGEISDGIIRNKSDDDSFSIQTDSASGTPESIMTETMFSCGEDVGGKEQFEEIYPKVIASTPMTVDGVDGKLFEITAQIKYKNAEEHGYFAVFTGNGKSYTVLYLTDQNLFEKNKDVVKSAIFSAKFVSNTGSTFTLKDGSISFMVPDGWTAFDTSDKTSSGGTIMREDTMRKDEAEIEIISKVLQKGDGETPDSIIKNNPPLSYESDKTGEIYPSITSGSTVSINGVEGKIYGLSAISSNYEMHGNLWLFVVNGKAYQLVFLTDKDNYNKYMDGVQNIISSAKFN